MEPANKLYLQTGNDHLDDLLSPDRKKGIKGGILIGSGSKRSDMETPIVVIEGMTGTGKTTLALQIAHAAAKQHNWVVLYYSLEQTFQSLYRVASNFGLIESEGEPVVEFFDVQTADTEIQFDSKESKIHFCHLSPRPFIKKEEKDVFEQRFAELNHVFNEVTEILKEQVFILVVIDSITALAGGRSLERNEIYRLFSLFRNYHIPGLITLEMHSELTSESEEIFFECTRFLSDIVISLTKGFKSEYYLNFIEIIKSRVGRQALGKHLYKMRTLPSANESSEKEPLGIVVYPSIHYVLSKARGQITIKQDNQKNFIIDKTYETKDEKKDLCLIFDNNFIMPNSCTAITGPNGTHKLALGINLAMGHFENQTTNLLIINFGGTGEFNFQGIAWTNFNKKWSKLKRNPASFTGTLMKYWHTVYGIGNSDSDPVVTITTFKIGQLSPEECFDAIEKTISRADEHKRPFSSVLLINTAELCTGFPLLKAEPLFLPALLDLFAIHGLVSICIGVEDKMEVINREANFTLLAKADYRIVMSHYPSIENLSRGYVEASEKKEEPRLKEQLISLVLDNVTGRHYMRQPKWIRVEECEKDGKITKRLHCENRPYLHSIHETS